MLSHWVVIRVARSRTYRAVVPSTRNSGPRNFNDEPGPYEQSLVGTRWRITLSRWRWCAPSTVRPCMSCAVARVGYPEW